jgi:hypothetical protein
MTKKHELDERLLTLDQPIEEYQYLREKLTAEATNIAARHGLIVSSIVFVIGVAIWRFPLNGGSHPFYPIPIIAVVMAFWCYMKSRRQLIEFAETKIEDLKKQEENNP